MKLLFKIWNAADWKHISNLDLKFQISVSELAHILDRNPLDSVLASIFFITQN